jgi:hydrogenase expression/formation protein HypC
MCLGIPMRMTRIDGGQAVCEGRGERRTVDIRLIDSPELGDWVLVFHTVARERLSEERARDVGSALDALEAALAGETDLDRHFADLVNREPELPEHLKKELKRG